ncbi:hypothetical protein HYT05_00820 [Candidatus Kaiserbacteria bacterium]|nr:hypothetical protein [Candidatus Kaiserbacteria bacterium]
MTNPEGAWKGPRHRRSEESVLTGDVSPERLDRYQDAPLNPEEALSAKEERKPSDGDLEYDPEWTKWVGRQIAEANSKRISDDHTRVDHPQGSHGEGTEYWDHVDALIQACERMGPDDDIQDLIKRFHLPKDTSLKNLSWWSKKENRRVSSHGRRGSEHPGKHQKGGETVRHPETR